MNINWQGHCIYGVEIFNLLHLSGDVYKGYWQIKKLQVFANAALTFTPNGDYTCGTE